MEYREIVNVKKPVSRIFFGTAMPLLSSGGDGTELLDAVLALGINAIDTARGYGLAERSLGNWMEKRQNRDKIVLLSKCAHPSADWTKRVNEKEIRADFQKSSEELRTDYIDIYLLHRDDPDVKAGDIVEILNALHAEGKIGAFGGSNWTHERIQEANEYAYQHNLIPFTVSSPNFGLADQVNDPWGGDCITISGSKNEAARAWYSKEQMPVIAYSSLGRGLFSGKLKSADAAEASKVMDEVAMKGYGCPENFERLRRCEIIAEKYGYTVPQIAMAWIYGQTVNTFAVVGSNRAERMKQNIDALSIKLTQEELLYLDLKAEKH